MDEPLGLVAKILPSSAVDGPGNRSVVFLQGCDFDCKYCHNPETRKACIHCGRCIPACPAGALSLDAGQVVWDRTRCTDCGTCITLCPHSASPKTRLISVGAVLNVIRPYLPFIRGLTVSGGECGLQAPFMTALVRRAREVHQLGTLIDTNGSTDYSQLPELVEMAEGFMLDVKAWDAVEHAGLTGAPNAVVLQNLVYLARLDKLYEVRTVVVPGQFNAEETVREVSRVLVAAQSRARYKIIGFRPQGVRPQFRNMSQPERSFLEQLAFLARSAGVRNILVV
ncbi:YjjW family glycine radical enzyme activase [Gracilinema caldarium]|uniref:Radical SAM domain protein n=1 Tax=Gracilinema caldarium (strain ATCC 51460 / DSM 7334 / H1) TaxID=744872 RepID=F8EZU0_GRAC1|nr:YjjW family glycine radical enzyme activase [Gracilinema caldarium]AEJ18453.1 Radical SAM domain protein [Gracilinema caldarium DSM 7334]